MRHLLVVATIAAFAFLACSGNDDGDTPATSTSGPPTATATPNEAPPTTTPGAPVSSSTLTVEPTSPAACGESLLSEDNPQYTAISQLEGSLVFSCGGQIWTSQPNGSDARQLTQPQAIDWQAVKLYRLPEQDPPTPEERADLEAQINTSPRWLADGRIAFASIRDTLRLSAESTEPRLSFVGASELYVINADGSNEQRITDYNLVEGSYRTPYSGEFDPAVECRGPDFCFAGLLRIRPLAAANTGPVLAAEVVEIHFSECCSYLGLLALSQPGVALEAIPAEDDGRRRPVGRDWSADDQAILTAISWRDEGNFPYIDLALDPEGQTASWPGLFDGVSLAPDGAQVAYCTVNTPAETLELQVTTLTSDSPRTLISMPWAATMGACAARWSPNGNHLVVAKTNGDIAVVDVATGEAIPVVRGLDPDWGP